MNKEQLWEYHDCAPLDSKEEQIAWEYIQARTYLDVMAQETPAKEFVDHVAWWLRTTAWNSEECFLLEEAAG